MPWSLENTNNPTVKDTSQGLLLAISSLKHFDTDSKVLRQRSGSEEGPLSLSAAHHLTHEAWDIGDGENGENTLRLRDGHSKVGLFFFFDCHAIYCSEYHNTHCVLLSYCHIDRLLWPRSIRRVTKNPFRIRQDCA
jgi:hypothetical protein